MPKIIKCSKCGKFLSKNKYARIHCSKSIIITCAKCFDHKKYDEEIKISQNKFWELLKKFLNEKTQLP